MTTSKAIRSSRVYYLLQHVAREGKDDEDMKVLGIYSSLKNAKSAVRKYKKVVGFRRYPEGFYIERWALNRGAWTEGFFEARKPPRRK